MKNEIGDTFFTETRITIYKIERVKLDFCSIKEWVKSSEQMFKKDGVAYKKRMFCQCCKIKFVGDQEGFVALAFSDKGNPILCAKCGKHFSDNLDKKNNEFNQVKEK